MPDWMFVEAPKALTIMTYLGGGAWAFAGIVFGLRQLTMIRKRKGEK